MSKFLWGVAIAVLVLAASASTATLGWWLLDNPADDITASVPGLDGAPERGANTAEPVVIGEFFLRGEGEPSDRTGEWPGFRGASRDNIVVSRMPLATDVPPNGFPVRWSLPLGEGHAGPAVWNGRVYVLDYDEAEAADALRCLSLDDGSELWRRYYRVKIKMNHGRSRTVPAVNEQCVLTIGPECHVMATHPISGDLLWSMDLVRDYGAETPLWYTGQCPLIDGGKGIIAIGGDDLLMAVDVKTGDPIWRTPNTNGYAMSHSSVTPLEILGRRMYVYAAIGGIVGVDPETGEVLWETSDFDARVIAPSPVALPDGYVFVTAGYGAGSILLRIEESAGTYSVETVSRTRPNEGFACEQQTPLVIDGLLFGIMPKDGGALRNRFVCWNPLEGLVWASGETERFGLGPYMASDGKLIILSDDGVLTLASQSSEAFQVLGTSPLLEGSDSWAPMALVNGLLLVRDSTMMKCIDLRLRADGET